jgi:hypothetical protein
MSSIFTAAAALCAVAGLGGKFRNKINYVGSATNLRQVAAGALAAAG